MEGQIVVDNELTIRAGMNKDYLPLKYEMKNLVLKIEISARVGTRIKELSKNICFVVDRSSSMDGIKIQLAKTAVKETIRSLSPSDTVSVVMFGGDVVVPLEASLVGDREALIHQIEDIKLGTLTDLHGGIEKGLEQLRKSAGKNQLNKMYLLTDGEANIGKVAPDDFRKIALQLKEHKVSVDTFGIGTDYNEDILNAIAGNSMGEWVHISEAPDLNAKVMDHVTRLKNVICSSPVLKITPINATKIYDVKRSTPSVREVPNVENDDKAVKFHIGDIDALESQTFFMRIDTKGLNEPGRHPVVKIEIEGKPSSAMTQNAIWTDDSSKLVLENNEIRVLDNLTTTIIRGLKNPNDQTILKDLDTLKTEVKCGPVATMIKEAETQIKSGESAGDPKQTKYRITHVTSLNPKGN